MCSCSLTVSMTKSMRNCEAGRFSGKRNALSGIAMEHDLGVVLVPTLVPGVNIHQIGAIIEFAKTGLPMVRGVHFQPVTYFGRYDGLSHDQ